MRLHHLSLVVIFAVIWAASSCLPGGGRSATAESPAMPADPPRLVAWGHSDRVWKVHLSPDGRWVLTDDGHRSVRLWDAETGREVRRLDPPGEEFYSEGFLPDGRRIILGSRNALHLLDPETGREVHRIEVSVARQPMVAFSPDGSRLLTGGAGPAVGEEGGVVIWDVEAERELSRFSLPENFTPVSFSADGTRIVVGDLRAGDGQFWLSLWDWETGRQIRRLERHESYHGFPTRYAGGKRALSVQMHGPEPAVEVVDAETGRVIRRVATGWVEAVTLSADGSRLFLDDRVLDVDTGREICILAHGRDEAFFGAAAFSADGRRVLTGAWDGRVHLWDAETGREIRRFGARSGPTGPSHFSPDRRRLLVTGGDGTAHLWDTTTGRRLHRLGGHDNDAYRAVFSPDGRRILTASWGGTARLWNAETGRELLRFEGHGAGLLEVTFSPDGRQVLTTSHDHTARLWDAETGREIRRFTGHEDSVRSAVFSPDGQRVATGSWDRTARLWDVETGRELRRFEHGDDDFEDRVMTVRFVDDGRRLLTSVVGGPLRRWDIDTGREIGQVGEAGRNFSVSDDGRRVVIVGHTHIDLWDLEGNRLLRRFERLGSQITFAALSPDGARLLVGEWGSALRILDAETGDRLGTVLMFTTGGWAVVDPEGRYDTSDPDDLQGLYWMVGTDVHPLGHFRVEYHDPGLLGKLLGHNPQPLRTIPRPAIVDF